MTATLATPVIITAFNSGGVTQTTSYTIPADTKWFVSVTDIDSSNTPANNTEVNLKTFRGADMGAAIARIASDAGGIGQLKNAYAVESPTAGAASIAIRHATTGGYNELFAITSASEVIMTVSPVLFGTGTSASITVTTQPGDLIVYSVSLNNSDPTAITASTTPPNDGQTLQQSGGAAASAGTRIFTKVASGSSTSAAWTFASSNRWVVTAFVFHENAQRVLSINGGADIVQGQNNVVANLDGFTGAITSITTDQTGVTVSNIGGTINAPEFDISGWSENQNYPDLPSLTEFVFLYSAEFSAGSEIINIPAGWVKQVFNGAIVDDDKYIGYWIAAQGHAVEGGSYSYQPFGDLVVGDDTGIISTSTGTFNSWFRPVSGATSGKMYYFQVTISSGEIVNVTGLTSAGLTMSGLTMVGLTAVGL